MRATLLVLLLACQGDPSSMPERAGKHTLADRGTAMSALSAGLDEAFVWLKTHPGDQAGALARARTQIGRYYTPEETDAFQLHVSGGELMIYIPTSSGLTVWLGRTENHLITEPEGLTPDARAKIGIK